MIPTRRSLALVTYGVLTYAVAMLVLAASVDFLAGTGLIGGVDLGPVGLVRSSLLQNAAWIALFGAAHGVMARPGFKRVWTRLVPPAAERSTHVLVVVLTLGALLVAWRPVPVVLWSAPSPFVAALLDVLFVVGTLLTLTGAFQVSHTEFGTRALHRIVRYPMQLGLLIMLWATPVFTLGRLELAAGFTLYILVGLLSEERALLRQFGAPYAEYQQRVPRLVPHPTFALFVAVLTMASVSAGIASIAAVSAAHATLESGGLQRRALVVRPAAIPRDSALGLVIALHDRAQDGALLRRTIGAELETLAAARGYLVAYPDGVGRSWNDCRARLGFPAHLAQVDDVAFLRALVTELVESHGVDVHRVVALGFSNGGHLAHRVAAEAPGLLSAVTVFGASLPVAEPEFCRAREQTPPTLFVTGADDQVNPPMGGVGRMPTGEIAGALLSARASAERLAMLGGRALVEPVIVPHAGHEIPGASGRAGHPLWRRARSGVAEAMAFIALAVPNPLTPRAAPPDDWR